MNVWPVHQAGALTGDDSRSASSAKRRVWGRTGSVCLHYTGTRVPDIREHYVVLSDYDNSRRCASLFTGLAGTECNSQLSVAKYLTCSSQRFHRLRLPSSPSVVCDTAGRSR